MAGLMDENQALLEQMGVSSPALDRLIEAARGAGAVGAKLSGAGRGGCILAAAERHAIAAVAGALRAAGAAQVLVTEVA
jgi:mevalonate kinase